jgi:hypothetical protein
VVQKDNKTDVAKCRKDLQQTKEESAINKKDEKIES